MLLAATVSGCGLVIDVDPPDPQLRDAAISDLGALDLDTPDARRPEDGGPPPCVEDVECSDDDPCNGDEVCTSSGCAPGAAPDCNDDVDCTIDSCTPFSGCSSEPSDALCTAIAGGVCDVASRACQYPTCTSATCIAPACSDAHCDGTSCVVTPLCTAAQECCGDSCVPVGCADDNPCTDDFCRPLTSDCGHEFNAVVCDDGDVCSIGDFCSAGACAGGARIACVDDGDPCTVESCDAALGCVSDTAPDGTSCDTGTDACTSSACSSGACMTVARFCPELDGNPCTIAACNSTTGECVTRPVPASTPCTLDMGVGMCDGAGVCVTAVLCAVGTTDCDGDGTCECATGAGGLCIGGRCNGATVCAGVSCGAGESCCPCTGACVLDACLSCCPSSC